MREEDWGLLKPTNDGIDDDCLDVDYDEGVIC